MIGKVIGTYQIREEIGQGPNGTVYQALDQAHGQWVALKAIKVSLARQAGFNQSLHSLATALTALQHPRLAAFYSLLQQGGELYLVSELVKGKSLARVLQKTSVLPPEQAVTLVIQALAALSVAHNVGLVHGGLKPGNLLLTAKDQLKLTDLGLAQVLGAENTQEGRGPGVLNYCAPEQVRGALVDARSDIYALGAVLFEMLTGTPPFRRANDAALRKAQLEDAPPSPRNYFPLIPPLLEQAVLRALSKEPAARFQSAHEFRQALLAWVDSQAVKPAPVAAPSVPASAPASNKPPTVPGAASATPTAATVVRPTKPASGIHKEVVVDLEERSAKRGFWKPLAAVAGVASLVGITYALLRVGGNPPAANSAPAAVQFSPTPAPSNALVSAAAPSVTPTLAATPIATPTLVATPSATPQVRQTPPPKQAAKVMTPVRPPVIKPKPAPRIVAKARPTPTPTKKKPYATPTPMAASKKERKESKKSGKGGGSFKDGFGGDSKEKKKKKP